MDMRLVMDAVIVLVGIYMAVISARMLKSGKVNEILLSEEERRRCRKPEAFVRYLAPRMLVFAVIAMLTGALGLLTAAVAGEGFWTYLFPVVFLLAFFVFSTQLRKAREDFVS